MNRTAAFSRFHRVMALVAVAMANNAFMRREDALANVGGYVSRGKGKTSMHRGPGNGASKSQRIALKARNRAHNRAAHRG